MRVRDSGSDSTDSTHNKAQSASFVEGSSPDPAIAVVAEIRKAGGSALAVLLDVVDAASVATGVERAARPDRRLDILVNNAGIGGPSPFDGDARSDEAWGQILEVNLTGTWRVCRAARPFLPARA